jgi:NAD-dependent SIR2 family protein deacetylase
VRNANKVFDHKTGRKCDDLKCGGALYDSIINFGESLPEREVNMGFENAELADVCLVLGSSLTVTPAANMAARVGKRKQNLVIVNL